MNLDELMAVWKLQDAAPLHDVNKTLLHLRCGRMRRSCRNGGASSDGSSTS